MKHAALWCCRVAAHYMAKPHASLPSGVLMGQPYFSGGWDKKEREKYI